MNNWKNDCCNAFLQFFVKFFISFTQRDVDSVASSDTEAGLRDHAMWLQSRDVIKMIVHRTK
jgi:hypothetical protein